MRVFLVSALAAIVVAIAAMYSLDRNWQTSDQAFTSTTNARYPHEDNSHNLVGKGWASADDH
jgi:hypothetical protein